jgi:hypothetical protein
MSPLTRNYGFCFFSLHLQPLDEIEFETKAGAIYGTENKQSNKAIA